MRCDRGAGGGGSNMNQSEQDKATTQLLADAKLGDDQAKQRLLEKVRPYVRQIAAKKMNGGYIRGADASDIAQSVVAAVMRHFDSFRGTRSQQWYAWTREIVQNEVKRMLRDEKSKQHEGLEQDAPVPNFGDMTPSRIVSDRESAARMMEAVGLLPQDDRQLIRLRWVENLPWSDVARQLQCSTVAARKRGHRALDKLKSILDDHDSKS